MSRFSKMIAKMHRECTTVLSKLIFISKRKSLCVTIFRGYLSIESRYNSEDNVHLMDWRGNRARLEGHQAAITKYNVTIKG